MTTSITLGPAQIVAPHDFGFQLRHYVVAPEVREGDRLVEILRTSTGRLVQVDVRSSGTPQEPSLELSLSATGALSPPEIDDIRAIVAWHLCLDEDLRPFYALVGDDPVLSASVAHNYGAKAKSSFSMFDGVIDVICAQNTAFRRLYAMRANLAAAFGDPFPTSGHVYRASPRPEQLAAAPVEAIRACGVGYRDRYIKAVAQTVADGFDVEALKRVPREEARRELLTLPGVGPYTADLALIIGARRHDAISLDVYLKEAIRVFYFGGNHVPEDELLRFAEERWGVWRGYAWLYLTTNTEVWARDLGISFRLRSGALSDPD